MKNRHDLKTYKDAQDMAERMTFDTQEVYLPIDHGPGCWPQFDVILAPVVGKPVSRGFNGDYYPEGVITKVSKTYHTVTTSSGATFRRRKNSARWMIAGGTWAMVHGTRNELSPSF